MKLLSIHLQNFRLHADTKIDFEEGVTGIIGTNETGKSTILEAIEWAFFGAKVTRGTKDSLRWKGAPPRKTASVTLRFEVGGTTYRIERSEGSAKLYDETHEQIIGDGTDAVNKHSPELLGETHETWIASRLVRQKDVSRIAAMLPTERLAFVRRIMGVGQIDRALTACRKQKSKLNVEREAMSKGLGPREPYADRVRTATEHLEGDRQEVLLREAVEEREKAEYAAAAAKLAESQETKDKALELEQALREEHARHDRAKAALERLQGERQAQQEAAPILEEAQDKLRDLPALRGRLKALLAAQSATVERKGLTEALIYRQRKEEEYLAEIKDLDAIIEQHDEGDHAIATADYAEEERWYTTLREERLKLRTEAQAGIAPAQKKAALAERRLKAIIEAGENGCCPTCTRRLDEHYQTVVDALETEVKEAQADFRRHRRMADELSEPGPEEKEALESAAVQQMRLGELEDKRRAAEKAADAKARVEKLLAEVREQAASAEARLAELPTTEVDPDELEEIEKQVDELTRLQDSDNLARARSLVQRISETKKEIAKQEDEIALTAALIQKHKEEVRAVGFDEEAHAEAEREERESRYRLEQARLAVAGARATVRSAKAEEKAAAKALEEYDDRARILEKTEQDHLLHERTAARLADFRVAIAATIRPEMEELMTGFVHLLTDGRHEAVELTEDFGVVLYEDGVPQEVVSGGTEDITALAMRLAISQMSTERAGQPLSLLVLDEPFGSLDETRRGNVIRLLRGLKNTFRQTIAISHVAETRDAVDHAIELEYDEALGASKVASVA